MKVSVIIPVFNEEKTIADCLNSLLEQSYKDIEIIIIDDGSTDKTVEIVKQYPVRLLTQTHQGPGIARNLGAKEAKGEILVFVDGDMVFDERFVEKLTEPIRDGQVIGTFSKEEFVLNKDNVWSKCWNINKGLPIDKMHIENYPDEQNVFRAILKREFLKVGGFTPIGYVDDHTIAEKLGVKAKVARGAVFYHRNPDNLVEVFQQARWIGKSEYKRRRIKNEQVMRLVTLIRYSVPLSIIKGLYSTTMNNLPQFLIFKLIYDLAVEISLIGSYFGEQKYK